MSKKKRKIVVEDIYFDSDGTDLEVSILKSDGSTTTGRALNCKHLPLTTALRTILGGAANLEAGLQYLKNNLKGEDATTENKGIVALATASEVQTGTNATKAVTPSTLKTLTGNANRIGLLQLATETEAKAGENTAKVITPSTLKAALNELSLPNSIEYGMGMDYVDNISVSFSAGQRFDNTYGYIGKATSEKIKKISETWKEGSNSGGRATNAPLTQDTEYYSFEIINIAEDKVDYGWDIVIDAANLLSDAAVSGYTHYRLRGSIFTESDSTDILPFNRTGNYFALRDSILPIDRVEGYLARTEEVIKVPTGRKVIIDGTLLYKTGSAVTTRAIWISSPDVNDQTIDKEGFCTAVSNANPIPTPIQIMTNTSGEISIKTTDDVCTFLKIYIHGWYDFELG